MLGGVTPGAVSTGFAGFFSGVACPFASFLGEPDVCAAEELRLSPGRVLTGSEACRPSDDRGFWTAAPLAGSAAGSAPDGLSAFPEAATEAGVRCAAPAGAAAGSGVLGSGGALLALGMASSWLPSGIGAGLLSCWAESGRLACPASELRLHARTHSSHELCI